MEKSHCRFCIGQLITHRLFDYRGVIVDIDPEFRGSSEWYEMMALSRPPKNKPWYHVLVHKSDKYTYVAEQNLMPDLSGELIIHPHLDTHFEGYKEGLYMPRQKSN